MCRIKRVTKERTKAGGRMEIEKWFFIIPVLIGIAFYSFLIWVVIKVMQYWSII